MDEDDLALYGEAEAVKSTVRYLLCYAMTVFSIAIIE